MASFRLRASRLCAGFQTATKALKTLQIPPATYQAAETGTRSVSRKIVVKVADAFQVSAEFLLEGVVTSDSEKRVAEVAKILARVASEQHEDTSASIRLRRARIAAGFATASAAAKAHQWKMASYSAHDGGTRPIPVDRLITYSAAFDIEPEFLVFGTSTISSDAGLVDEPTDAAGRGPSDVTKLQVRASASNSLSPPDYGKGPAEPSAGNRQSTEGWAWLEGQSRGSSLNLPVLITTESGAFEEIGQNIRIPEMLVPGSVERSETFALVRDSRSGSNEILVLKRYKPGDMSRGIFVSYGNRIDRVERPSQNARYEDPTLVTGSNERPVVLGSQLARIGVNWST